MGCELDGRKCSHFLANHNSFFKFLSSHEYKITILKLMTASFDLTLFSKINTCCTNNDVTYIIMPRIARESSVYLFPLWSFHNKIADKNQ